MKYLQLQLSANDFEWQGSEGYSRVGLKIAFKINDCLKT